MSDPEADSTFSPDEATGRSGEISPDRDSTPDPAASDQEQGDQSKRVNGLMSLANKRLAERDQALAEIEQLRQQLEAQTIAEQSSMDGQSQVEMMFPERFAQPEPEPDEGDDEPQRVLMEPNAAARPDYAAMRFASQPQPAASTPSARWASDQVEISRLKTQLNAAGEQWAREAGIGDD